MTTIERSISVHSDPDKAFAYLSDVGNLPRYFDKMTSAESTGSDEVHVVAKDTGEGTVEGEAWFRTDDSSRRVEWGSESNSDYSGWLQVEDGDRDGTSNVRLGMHLHEASGERGVDQTLENLKTQLEA